MLLPMDRLTSLAVSHIYSWGLSTISISPPFLFSRFALTLTLYSVFCVSEAGASQWHEPRSCKTNKDWDLCGLSILSPFQCKTLRMEWGEGATRGERSSGKVGGEIRGRCPSLRGCNLGICVKRKTERPLSLNHTTSFHYFYGSMPLKSHFILSKHITAVYTHGYIHIHLGVFK